MLNWSGYKRHTQNYFNWLSQLSNFVSIDAALVKKEAGGSLQMILLVNMWEDNPLNILMLKGTCMFFKEKGRI